jgi:hypothetical protein
MGFSFIALVSGLDDGSGTTLDASASLNVAAGDVLVAYGKHEGSTTSISVAKDTGSPANTHTFDAGDYISHGNGDMHASFGYLLSASADATATFRMTLGAARAWRRFFVAQFRPDSGDTCTKDAANEGTGSSSAFNSGNISTTGDDEIVVGAGATYTGDTSANELINGVSATEPTGSPIGAGSAGLFLFYRILSATFTNGAATADSLNEWIGSIIAIKATAGGSDTPITPPVGSQTLAGVQSVIGTGLIPGTMIAGT